MLKSQKNEKRLEEAYIKLGRPRTYFFKKTSAMVSKDRCIEEAANMLESLVKIRKDKKNETII